MAAVIGCIVVIREGRFWQIRQQATRNERALVPEGDFPIMELAAWRRKVARRNITGLLEES
jgi:hypothetical protein